MCRAAPLFLLSSAALICVTYGAASTQPPLSRPSIVTAYTAPDRPTATPPRSVTAPTGTIVPVTQTVPPVTPPSNPPPATNTVTMPTPPTPGVVTVTMGPKPSGHAIELSILVVLIAIFAVVTAILGLMMARVIATSRRSSVSAPPYRQLNKIPV